LFDNAIHVVCTGASNCVTLTMGGKVFHEVLIGEDAIVGAVFLDSVLVLLAKLFILLLSK